MNSTPIPPSHRPTSPDHQHQSGCPPQDLSAPPPTTDRWTEQALKSQATLDDSVFDAMDSIRKTLDQVQQRTRALETNVLSSLEPIMKMDHFLATTRMLSDIVPPPSVTNGLAALSQTVVTPPALPRILTSPGINLLPQKEIFQPMHDIVQQKLQMAILPTQLAANNLQAITAGIMQSALDAATTNMSIAASLAHASFNEHLFVPPALSFPAFHIVKYDFWQTAFLPDMTWTAALTEQLNALLKILPDWPSIDPRHFKKNLKKRIIDALGLLGLCFAPSMSEDMMYEVLDRVELGNKKTTVQLLIWNYYAYQNHRRLRQAVEQWQDNPEYARRWRDYLHPAFIAHTQGHYGLSISALMPMVEGIASHIVQRNGLKPTTNPQSVTLGLGSTKDVIVRTLKKAGDEATLENDDIDLAHWVRVHSAIRFVEDKFCQRLAFENDYDHLHFKERALHRHGSLHGIQLNSAKAHNSLKLFLLLDTMYYLLQTYTARGGLV